MMKPVLLSLFLSAALAACGGTAPRTTSPELGAPTAAFDPQTMPKPTWCDTVSPVGDRAAFLMTLRFSVRPEDLSEPYRSQWQVILDAEGMLDSISNEMNAIQPPNGDYADQAYVDAYNGKVDEYNAQADALAEMQDTLDLQGIYDYFCAG